MKKKHTRHNYLYGALVTLVIIGIVFMIATAVQDWRSRSGAFTTSGQVREYWRNK